VLAALATLGDRAGEAFIPLTEALRTANPGPVTAEVDAAQQLRVTVVGALVPFGGDPVLVADVLAARPAGRRPGSLDALARKAALAGFDGERLVDALIRFESDRHIQLVKHQANRVAKSYPHYTPEDLFGFGWRGLLAALRKYSPDQHAFATYACTRIAGAIKDGIRSESWVPKRLGTWARKAATVEDELFQLYGRRPTEDEMARELAVRELARQLKRNPTLAEIDARIDAERTQLKMLSRLNAPASLDERAGVEGAADDAGPEEELVGAARRAAVLAAVDELPPVLAEAVRLLDLEQRSFADAQALTGATARQLRERRAQGRALLAERLVSWREALSLNSG
jgi:RNA polymerase sigma factor (sigma-70 family)